MQKPSLQWLGTAALLFALTGCGGGSSTDTAPQSATGYYVDAPLVDIDYRCGSFQGHTDNDGAFTFEPGKGCTFSLATLKIREIDASLLQDQIVIIESDSKIAALLQSLDTTPQLPESIVIDRELGAMLQEHNLTELPQNDTEREAFILRINQMLGQSRYQAHSEAEAMAHVRETIAAYRSTLNYLTQPLDIPQTPAPADETEERDTESNTSEETPVAEANHTTDTSTEETNSSIDRPEDNNTSPDSNSSEETNTTDEENNTTTPEDNSTAPGDDNTSEEANSSAPDDDNTSEETNSSEEAATPLLIYTKLDEHLYLNEKKDVALYIADDLNKSEKLIYNYSYIQTITNKLYEYFNDAYDFIFLVTNNDEQPATVTYSGVFMKVKNDVEGIGAPIYSNTRAYGSAERLKGVMHFAYRGAVLRGPVLHEISHYWANKFDFDFNEDPYYRLGSSGHWSYLGFFGGKGQLGGYDAHTLEQTKDTDGGDLTFTDSDNNLWKVYSAESFGWNANGGGSIPYNDLELYLMGMIPKSDVADIMVPAPYGSPLTPDTNAYIVDNNLEVSGRSYFMAQNILRKSWEEIMSDHHIPERDPDASHSQKDFKVLTVLLDTQMPQLHEVNGISLQMEKFARQGDDGIDFNYNFWEATRHIGTLSSDRLDTALITDGEAYPIEDSFHPEEILFHDKIYHTVRSPYTGRIWLDRNIGASRVCESFTDRECYGDYFVFGRGPDGHQLLSSPTTTQKQTSITPDNDAFVLVDYNSGYDWVEAGVDETLDARLEAVQKLDGSGICPAGFLLPSYEEFYAETRNNIAWDSFPSDHIDGNFLRLPFTGYRNAQDAEGRLDEEGVRGAYWTRSTFGDGSDKIVQHILFNTDSFLSYGTRYFSNAEAIRCIKAAE